MIRKSIIALAAAAAIGAALAPTAASAHGFHFHGFHHHVHGPWFGLGVYGDDTVADSCYYVRKPTRYGYKLIEVCG